ncbi:MAG: endonuclease [Ferruginibacter sp.]
MKESVQEFKRKKILEATGNAKIDKTRLLNKTIIDFKSFGKQFLICLPSLFIRIHFLLFGSYSVNEQTKTDRGLRLKLRFKNGSLFFYTCSIKLIEEDPDKIYDWSADIMNDDWDRKKAIMKLKECPETLICDALLDQHIFAGLGNIIKNEVLYRVKIHPASIIGKIPAAKLSALVKEARNYSFDFLKWKKAYELKKHWLAHTKQICLRCNLPIIKTYLGKTNRRTFYCINCQKKYD